MPDKKSSEKKSADPEKKGGIKRLLPVAVIGIVMLGGGYFVGGMMAAGSDAAAVAEATDEADVETEEKVELGHLESLEAVNVNLQDGHFLRIAVTLEIGSGEKAGDDGKEAAAFPTAPAADLVLSTFSGRSIDDLSSETGREAARKELLEAVEAKYGDKVVSLYFTEFVMQ